MRWKAYFIAILTAGLVGAATVLVLRMIFGDIFLGMESGITGGIAGAVAVAVLSGTSTKKGES